MERLMKEVFRPMETLTRLRLPRDAQVLSLTKEDELHAALWYTAEFDKDGVPVKGFADLPIFVVTEFGHTPGPEDGYWWFRHVRIKSRVYHVFLGGISEVDHE